MSLQQPKISRVDVVIYLVRSYILSYAYWFYAVIGEFFKKRFIKERKISNE